MNQKQSWKEKFYEKFPQKIAGVIDDFGSNEKEEIGNFIEEIVKQAIQTRERDLLGEKFAQSMDKDFYKGNPIYEMGRRDREREISEELKKMRAESGDYCEEECEHGECYLAGAEEKVIDKVLSIINKKCACKKISEKYPGGIYFTEVKTANGGIPGIVHVKCPVHD